MGRQVLKCVWIQDSLDLKIDPDRHRYQVIPTHFLGLPVVGLLPIADANFRSLGIPTLCGCPGCWFASCWFLGGGSEEHPCRRS
jgi:hypothetical protein